MAKDRKPVLTPGGTKTKVTAPKAEEPTSVTKTSDGNEILILKNNTRQKIQFSYLYGGVTAPVTLLPQETCEIPKTEDTEKSLKPHVQQNIITITTKR